MEEILDFDKQEGSENQKPHLETLAQGYHLEIGSAFSRGWAIFAKYPWGFMGYSILCFFLILLSVIALGFTIPSLVAGYDVVAGKIAREEQHEFSDFFGGFEKFGAFAGLWGLYLLLSLGLAILGLGAGAAYSGVNAADISSFQDLQSVLSSTQGFGLQDIVSMIFNIVLYTFIIFLFPLIAVSKLGLMDAIKWSFKISAKKFGILAVVVIVSYIMTVVGFLLCFIPIIFAFPVATLLKFGAYDEIFGSHSRENEV